MNITPDTHSIQLYYEYDGWSLQIVELSTNKVVKHITWNHNESELGVGGEKLMLTIFDELGYHTYSEEVY